MDEITVKVRMMSGTEVSVRAHLDGSVGDLAATIAGKVGLGPLPLQLITQQGRHLKPYHEHILEIADESMWKEDHLSHFMSPIASASDIVKVFLLDGDSNLKCGFEESDPEFLPLDLYRTFRTYDPDTTFPLQFHVRSKAGSLRQQGLVDGMQLTAVRGSHLEGVFSSWWDNSCPSCCSSYHAEFAGERLWITHVHYGEQIAEYSYEVRAGSTSLEVELEVTRLRVLREMFMHREALELGQRYKGTLSMDPVDPSKRTLRIPDLYLALNDIETARRERVQMRADRLERWKAEQRMAGERAQDVAPAQQATERVPSQQPLGDASGDLEHSSAAQSCKVSAEDTAPAQQATEGGLSQQSLGKAFGDPEHSGLFKESRISHYSRQVHSRARCRERREQRAAYRSQQVGKRLKGFAPRPGKHPQHQQRQWHHQQKQQQQWLAWLAFSGDEEVDVQSELLEYSCHW